MRGFNGKSLILLSILTVGLLFSALIVRSYDQNALDDKQCQTLVVTRNDHRATWQELRSYLLKNQPKSQHRLTNELVEVVLQVIPPLECVDGNPEEVK